VQRTEAEEWLTRCGGIKILYHAWINTLVTQHVWKMLVVSVLSTVLHQGEVWRRRVTAPHVLKIGTRTIWIFSFRPRTLFISETVPLLEGRLASSGVGRLWRGDNSLTSAQNWKPILPCFRLYTNHYTHRAIRVVRGKAVIC
jgi:hypothetical protein